jgi:hypothetical protein
MSRRSPREMKELMEAYKDAVRHCKYYNQKSDLWLIRRMFAYEFLAATLTPGQYQLYEVLLEQMNSSSDPKAGDRQPVVIPAGADEKDARRVLQLIKLQYDPILKFHVTWEGQPGKTKVMTEPKPKHFRG